MALGKCAWGQAGIGRYLSACELGDEVFFHDPWLCGPSPTYLLNDGGLCRVDFVLSSILCKFIS